MRVTFGTFRSAARNPGLRASEMAGRPTFPTPAAIASASIVRYHREGRSAAWRRLNQAFQRSDYWGPNGNAQARGWADSIRNCFNTYADRADQDHRQVFWTRFRRDVRFASHELSAAADIVLLDDVGYTGRLVLWDTPELTRDLAELMACPIVIALGDGLGANRISGVEVWHLRSGTQVAVGSHDALRRSAQVSRILADFADE